MAKAHRLLPPRDIFIQTPPMDIPTIKLNDDNDNNMNKRSDATNNQLNTIGNI